jgi:GPH family glycoside/pentoside/hexuronide:cation symporter
MPDSPQRHHTSAADRVPWVQLIAYGLGGFVPIALFNSVGQLSGLIVNVGLGVSAILVGVAQMVPRLWDAVTDPVMGHLSDNTRTRFGRRRPYILLGGLAVAVSFVAMWSVPREWGAMEQFWYFLLTSLVFYTAVTVFEIPHGALGMEMTPDYHERTKLFSVKSFVGNLGAMITPWFYAMANWPLFMAGGDEVDGMRNVAYLAALVVLIPAFGCAFLCKEREFHRVASQRRVSLATSLGVTLRNRTFLILVGVVFATVMGFNFVNNFANFITIFYLFEGRKQEASALMGWIGTAWAITAVVAVFPLNWISRRAGKTRTLSIAVLLMLGAQLLKIVCYNPEAPWLLFIPTVMLSAGMLFFFTLASAMVADVCDEDELGTGTRSEGAYYSVFWWFMKMGMAGAYFVAGLLLAGTGFDEWRAAADAAEEAAGGEWFSAAGIEGFARVTLLLRVVEIGVPIGLCAISLWFIRRYPLSESRAYEVKRRLDARRAADLG